MAKTIFASKAAVGARYITTGGCPITILQIGLMVKVRDDLYNKELSIYPDQLLWPYSPKRISKEATAMANAHKKAAKSAGKEGVTRGGERGTKRTSEGILLFRKIGTVMHEALYKEGVLIYRTKHFLSLKELASAMRGKAISGSGRSFFGLRHNGNIELGKEIWKGLKAAAEKAEKPAKAPKKAKKAKEAEDEDGGRESKKEADKPAASVAQLVNKVFGKSRR